MQPSYKKVQSVSQQKKHWAYWFLKENVIMRQCFLSYTGFLYRTKLILTYSAKWADPILWEVFKCCTWLNAVFGVTNCRVVFPTANITYILFHNNFVFIV